MRTSALINQAISIQTHSGSLAERPYNFSVGRNWPYSLSHDAEVNYRVLEQEFHSSLSLGMPDVVRISRNNAPPIVSKRKHLVLFSIVISNFYACCRLPGSCRWNQSPREVQWKEIFLRAPYQPADDTAKSGSRSLRNGDKSTRSEVEEELLRSPRTGETQSPQEVKLW